MQCQIALKLEWCYKTYGTYRVSSTPPPPKKKNTSERLRLREGGGREREKGVIEFEVYNIHMLGYAVCVLAMPTSTLNKTF